MITWLNQTDPGINTVQTQGKLTKLTINPQVYLSQLGSHFKRCLDVGSHHGEEVPLLLKICDKVLAIESDPGNVRKIRDLYRSEPRLSVIDVAATSHWYGVRFGVANVDYNSCIDCEFNFTEVISTASLDIADLLTNNILIKIDVQGHEQVLVRRILEADYAAITIITEVNPTHFNVSSFRRYVEYLQSRCLISVLKVEPNDRVIDSAESLVSLRTYEWVDLLLACQ